MKSWGYRGVWVFICLVGVLFLWQAGPTRAQEPAPPKGKPALYEFGAKYCLPCKEMQKVMAALKTSHGSQMEFRMIYLDQERPIFEKYKIVAIPTQVFLDASGKEVDRHMGALSKEDVVQKLKDLKFIQ